MREKEQKRYIIGIAVLFLTAVVAFLLFFQMEIQRLDKEYNQLLQEMATNIYTQMNGSENATADVTEYLRQHGYLDMKISRMSDGIPAKWNFLTLSCLIFLCIIFSFQIFFGIRGFQGIYQKIDNAVDLLTKIIGESKKTVTSTQWEEWKKLCAGQYTHGTTGRLYKQIWETAQIAREREQDRIKEQLYLREMMSDISHQIKTPLASLQVFVDIFSREIDRISEKQADIPDEKTGTLKEMVIQANHQIERMRWLIMGMLKLAQVESGVLQWDNKLQPVCFTLEKSIDALRVTLEQKEQTVELIGDRDALLLHDADWMQEAVVNLLKNASEYAPRQEIIRISIEQTSLAVVIAIEDHGPGIEKDKLPKIFNRFYSIRNPKHGDGVGIGLALAKSIIEAQGGTITVFSQTGESSYTRFVLTFLMKL